MIQRSSVAELVEYLRSEVNRYSPGEKLPGSREWVERYRVSPVTVSRAVARLVAEGLVTTRPGAGAYRAEPRDPAGGPAALGDTSWQEVALSSGVTPDASGLLAAVAGRPAGVTELNSGYLHSSLQPERALAAALARAGRRPGAWARPPLEGLPDLRAWFAREIGGPLTADDVLITAGGQSALSTVVRALAPPGAPVLVESPTYPGLLAIVRGADRRPLPVPVDAGGLRVELLDRAFRATGARLLVCQPLFHNPTGAVLAADRRPEVLRIARAAGAFVVEDDYARHLGHSDGPALPPTLAAEDPDGVVVHLRSLTKPASPNLRVAALAARGAVRERLRATQVVDSFFVSRPLQEAALDLVASPAWARHLRTVGEELRLRRRALADAVARHLPELALTAEPRGGYHLWLRVETGADGDAEAAFTARALRAGVAVAPGRPYFCADPPGPHVRLGFAAAPRIEDLTEAPARIGASRPTD
ncbi:PLP-dependent aminotransferase family protein [Streptomyces sp. BI20]|uniref:aminotransferase-like domain-containing protein n=1 Tax=Streptomyces sp. BI20 TaxID=3403460 RepID=UPI003C73CCFD